MQSSKCWLKTRYQLETEDQLSISRRSAQRRMCLILVSFSVNTVVEERLTLFPALYGASKATSVALTRSTALDYAKHRIRVNAVCPGTIKTGMVRAALDDPSISKFVENGTPWPRLGEPEDIGKAVLFLCSDASSFTTGTIHVVTVDGGMTCA